MKTIYLVQQLHFVFIFCFKKIIKRITGIKPAGDGLVWIFFRCRFIDDLGPVVFATKITRTIYLENCQWNVKALPAEFVVEQKKMSEMP